MRLIASTPFPAPGVWAGSDLDHCDSTELVLREYEGIQTIHMQALCPTTGRLSSLPLDKCMGNDNGRLVWRKELAPLHFVRRIVIVNFVLADTVPLFYNRYMSRSCPVCYMDQSEDYVALGCNCMNEDGE